MNILVTGGTGYIGSHTVVELLNAGHEVIILDNLSNSKKEVVDCIETITGKRPIFYQVDLLDKAATEQIFCAHTIDAVIHFAGKKAVGESVQLPVLYYQNNITGTLNLLECMLAHNCKKIVFSSSATVYGMNNPSPLKEDMPLSATSPYAFSKLAIEQILRDVATSDPDFTAMLLRYFNPIGAHASGLIGENPNGIPNNLLPYITMVAARKLDHLNVFGNDYDTPDGTGIRDYIHVTDLAIAHVKACEYLTKTKGADAINLGTGHGYSVLDIIHAFETACQVSIPYQITARRPGDVAILCANPQKAADVLGWKAQYDIAQMCKDAWNFTKKNTITL